jgi:hypothetical protein
MTDLDDIALGRQAWQKISKATTFTAWKAIAIAVSIGRQHALRLASCNAPHGARYSRAFNAWLDQNGFSSMPYGTRAACCKLADNMVGIEAWRASLPKAAQETQNHPEVIIRNWRKAMRPEQPSVPVLRHHVKSDRPQPAKGSRQVFWPQDAVKRAADGLRQCRSHDLYTMARAALEGAVRGRDDLLELLNEAAPPTRAPIKSTPAVMALV